MEKTGVATLEQKDLIVMGLPANATPQDVADFNRDVADLPAGL